MEIRFLRNITHTKYPFKKKKNAFWAGLLEKRIFENPSGIVALEKNGNKNSIVHLDNNCIQFKVSEKVVPLVGGGVSLLFVILYLLPIWEENPQPGDEFGTFVFILCCILVLFFVLYYFFMPKKELLWDRKNETLTFTGFYWHKNYTMSFDQVLLKYTGGARGSSITPFRLAVIRPDKMGSAADMVLSGDLYKDLSLLVWYMDKNRPLPPGNAFDPYRQKDFERRKAEGFPPPQYQSNIKTPEATKEQQAERDKFWKG